MRSTITTETLQKIFTFPFKDERWASKFTLGSLFYFLGILIVPGLFVSGYSYEIMRRIIVDKAEPSLPEWDDYGKYLQDGFKIFGVTLIFGSPALMFIFPYFVLIFLLPLISMSEETSAAFFAVFPLTFVLIIIGSLVGFVFGIFGLAAKAHMVAKGEFVAAFRVREWGPIFRKNMGGFLLGYLLIIAMGSVIGIAVQFLMLTVVLCLLVPVLMLVVHFYTVIVSSALFAQAYVDGVENLASAEVGTE